MNIFIKNTNYILVCIFLLNFYAATAQSVINKDLEHAFMSPPESVQTGVYWYWIDGNITKEGVIKDLEAMKSVGINRAFIGNLGGHEMGDPKGPKIEVFSEAWWDITHAALKKAGELGIEIGFFNSPGWSQAGGPWVKSNEAMRFLASTSTMVKGPGKVSVHLEEASNAAKIDTWCISPTQGPVAIVSDKLVAPLEDVKVIAYPAPEMKNTTLNRTNATITATPSVEDIEKLFDSDKSNGISFPDNKRFSIDFKTKDDFTARSLTIYPIEKNISTPVTLQVVKNGAYVTVSTFTISRTNSRISSGYEPWAPVVISLDAVKGREFRLIFEKPHPGTGIAEIELSSIPKVERYKEKIMAKMYDGATPAWDSYMWRDQPETDDKSLVVKPEDVLDISDKMSADGMLEWYVPPGEWIVLRTGMLLTGTINAPAMPGATGWEVDKMSKEHIETHFNGFIGKILERIPAEDRKTFRVVVQDSHETGGQNFTDDFLKSFQDKFGYDPLPYLPAYFGVVVGSQQESDRFLWDVRRLVADKTAYDYVGGLRAACHKHGLTTWLENYGHFGFPGEFLQYGGQADEVGGEFWGGNAAEQVECKLASSSAHIYGKNLVSAESSTSGGPAYYFTPELLKKAIDCSFTKGVNNTVLHVFVQQPDDRAPGFNAWFGTEYDRNNVWFEQMDQFLTYIKRCNYLLRQGSYVADVAYFIGEDAPKMDGVRNPELPRGYQYDYINAEVLVRDAFVKDGKLTLPHGTSYRVLVLPKIETMRPAMIDKLKKLIADGAIVVGPAPKRSPSLENQPWSDEHVNRIAAEIWGNVDGVKVKSGRYGKGFIYDGVELSDVLAQINCVADCYIPESAPLAFTHQADNGTDIYYIANPGDDKITTDISFRVKGKQPELWIPTTGSIRNLPAFTQKDETTVVPVTVERGESFFIVFRNPGKPEGSAVEKNFPDPVDVSVPKEPWQVSFTSKVKQPDPIVLNELIDLSTHSLDKVKYFSGKATYTTTIDGVKPAKGERILLNLGKVSSMAKVKVNGVYAGGVWTYPFNIDVTKYIKKGKNKIEIEVVNRWVNRIIGDLNLPENERDIDMLYNPYKADSKLVDSGLIGPVKLEKITTGKL